MAAPLQSPPRDRSKRRAEPSADPENPLCALSAEAACAEAPLTSEPPLPDLMPLTSEPPLPERAPLTSESPLPDLTGPTSEPAAVGPVPTGP